MKKFTTTNIDEAAFLVLHGHDFEITNVAKRNSIYVFKRTEKFNEDLKKFWSNGALVDVHTWISVRTSLKNSVASLLTSHNSMVERSEMSGTPYWFIHGGSVMHCLYGKSPIHEMRREEGNFFTSKEAAEAFLKK